MPSDSAPVGQRNKKTVVLADVPVLRLWRFKLRRLAVCQSERSEFWMWSASIHWTEREAVAEIKKRFTPEWWAEVLIQDVSEEGDLHMIAGVPLYERD